MLDHRSQEVTRYLRALERMVGDTQVCSRRFARQCLRDMAEPGVSVQDYLGPYMKLPLAALDGAERRLRLLATNHPLARYAVPVGHPPA